MDLNSVYSLSDWREFNRFMNYQPDAIRGALACKSQKKRRLKKRRRGGKKK